jgi:Flp pilus assembly pilin Flp
MGSTRRRRTDRGATATEYALVMALVVLISLSATAFLEDEAGDQLSQTGQDIGTPRERVADMDPDLPDPPAWLP